MLYAQVRNAVSIIKRFQWVVKCLVNAEQMCVSSISHPHTSFCWIGGICAQHLWVFWSLKQGFRNCSCKTAQKYKIFLLKTSSDHKLGTDCRGNKVHSAFLSHHLSRLTAGPLCDNEHGWNCFQPFRKQQGNWHHSPQWRWTLGQGTLRTLHLS